MSHVLHCTLEMCTAHEISDVTGNMPCLANVHEM